MTYSELNTAFLVGYDSIASFEAAGLLDNEIDLFLRKGETILIDELFKARKFELLKEIIVDNDNLDFVTASSNLYNNATSGSGERVVEIDTVPTDIYKIIEFYGTIFRLFHPTTTNYVESFELIDITEISQYLTTGDNKPMFRRPKYIVTDNNFVVIGDAFTYILTTSGNAKLTYLKQPVEISNSGSVTSELNSKLHEKIVEKAIEYAFSATRPERAVINVQTNNAIENDSGRNAV